MKTFAFLIQPSGLEEAKEYWPILRFLPDPLGKFILKQKKSFKTVFARRILSSKKSQISGFFLVSPLIPENVNDTTPETVLENIISAGRMAEKLGADIIGLNGYLSLVADKKRMIYRHIRIPITTGNAFLAWSVFEAVYRLVRERKIDPLNAPLAIIGASSCAGSLCALKFSEYFTKIIVNGQDKNKLNKLAENISLFGKCQPVIESDVHKAVESAKIVILFDELNGIVPFIKDFAPGSIICDATLSKSIYSRLNERKDLEIIKGGLVKLPCKTNLGLANGFKKGLAYASVAEVMLLLFTEKLVNYSLGESINVDKMEEIADFAAQYGFETFVS